MCNDLHDKWNGKHKDGDTTEYAASGADAEVVEVRCAEQRECRADHRTEEVVAREDGGHVTRVAVWKVAIHNVMSDS